MRGSYILALLAILTGCVFGTPTKVPQQRPFRESVLEFIEVGVTTKDQVRNQLAHDPATSEREPSVTGPRSYGEGEWWVYSATREMWKWWWCGGAAVGYGVGDAGCGVSRRGRRQYRLLVRFSEADAVAGYGIVEEGGCAANLACFERGRLVVLAEALDDAAAKDFRHVPGRCGLYVYSAQEGPSTVVLDDEQLGSLLGPETFYHRIVSTGQHHLVVGSGSLTIQCDRTPLLFAEYWRKGDSRELRLARESSGRNAVAKRHLALKTVGKQMARPQPDAHDDMEYEPIWEN